MNSKYKMMHLLGLPEEELEKKIRVQQKYDKLRKIIIKKM